MVWYSDHRLAFLMYVPASLAGLLATQVCSALDLVLLCDLHARVCTVWWKSQIVLLCLEHH